MSLARFVYELALPHRPHGEDVEVVYDLNRQEVVSAAYVGEYRDVDGDVLRLVDCVVAKEVQRWGGWDNFSRRKVRVIPE